MALITLNQPVQYPGVVRGTANSPAVASMTGISAAGNATVMVCRAMKTISGLAQIEWLVNTFTSNAVIDVRIETVLTSTGVNSGTLLNTAGSGSHLITSTITGSGWQISLLSNSVGLNQGDVFAVEFLWQSGNISLGRVSNFSTNIDAAPYIIQNGTKTNYGGAAMILALSDGLGGYLPIPGTVPPVTAVANTTFNNVSNPASRALRFQLPFAARLDGVAVDVLSLGGNFNIVLYDGSGTSLFSQFVSGGTIWTGGTPGMAQIYFATPQVIPINTTRYISLEPQSAVNSQMTVLTLNGAGLTSSMPGGSQFFAATRTGQGSGAFTDSSATYNMIELLLTQFSDNVSSGGTGGGIICGDAGGPMRAEMEGGPLLLGALGAAAAVEQNPTLSRRVLMGISQFWRGQA